MYKDVHSEAARMPLVLNSSDVFCLQKTRVQELTRMSSSEPPWMAVVPCSNEFAIRKLMSSGCHGRHPLDSVRDCSDSLFAVETSQAQFMKRMRNNTAEIAANTAKSYKRKARRLHIQQPSMAVWICVNRNALFFTLFASSLFTAYYSVFAA